MIRKIFLSISAIILLCIIFLTLINFWPHSKSQDSHFDNVIVFGDSLSDSSPMGIGSSQVGNNYWTSIAGITNRKGAPITSRVGPHDLRRLTWLNYLVSSISFNKGHHFLAVKRALSYLNPYYENVSYAVASAETGNNYIDDLKPSPWPVVHPGLCQGISDPGKYSCVPGLLKQVHMYLEDVKSKPNPKTLFILWAGGNDFYQNIVKLMTESKDDLSQPISNTVKAVKLLLKEGVPANNIYVLNLPNFSMVPAITTLVGDKIKEAWKQSMALQTISLVSKAYNLWLKAALTLQTYGEFSPAHVFPVDSLFLNVYENKDNLHQKLGITTPVAITCVSAKKLPFCKGVLFYNDMHPTSQIHQYLAEQLGQYIE
ncbi:SGNH/GDSL hydrolase family protein [Francisellaceae bacterium]|nr:SGNH/GDSL hydrolase family protein [Francisellaceae bacterium]